MAIHHTAPHSNHVAAGRCGTMALQHEGEWRCTPPRSRRAGRQTDIAAFRLAASGHRTNVEGCRRRAGASNGSGGPPYKFNVTTEDGKPVVFFAYASRALAEAAATHLESALLNALSVHPHAD